MIEKKFIKISNILDKIGFYNEADKLDKFVKLAQYAKMPSQYEPTQFPRTGNPLIDSAFTDLKNSAFGYHLAGENQYDMKSPYKSEFGPTGPSVLPTLSPEQFAQMEKEGRFQEIFDLQMQAGMQAQNYLALSNENLIGLSTLISKYANPNVSKNVRESFFNYVLPNTITKMITQDLEVRPIAQWSDRLNELLTVLRKTAPNQVLKINVAVRSALNSMLDEKDFDNRQLANEMRNNPKWKQLSNELNLKLPVTPKEENAFKDKVEVIKPEKEKPE